MQFAGKTLGVTLVALVAVVGVAAASPFAGVAAADSTTTQFADEDRPLNGTNSPWIADDDRLDRFQDRFNLTDEQLTEIQTIVVGQIEDGANRTEIRTTVSEMLTEYGVEDTVLGPPADTQARSEQAGDQRAGPANGQGAGPADGTGYQHGGSADTTNSGQQDVADGQYGHGNGPHGPADGSCLD